MEQCSDSVDNNCDGSVDEGFEEIWEPNDLMGPAWDLGEIPDGDFVELKVMLDDAADQEWFLFKVESDGERDYAAEVEVVVTNLPPDWVVSLEVEGAVEDSGSDSDGDGQLVLKGGDGDSDNEIEWTLSIQTSSWTSASCEAAILTIYSSKP